MLQGKADIQKIVHVDDLSGLHCITAGTHTYDPQKLLGSPLADKLFSDFKRDYDIVLIDSPPTMVASDPAVLAKHSNTALYIVEWDRTPRRAVQAGVEYLRSFNIHVAGVVLSKVDLDRQRQYGDYVDFCFRYGEYYGN